MKTDRTQTLHHLLITGLNNLKNNAKIADAGCGSGIVSEVISDFFLKQKKHISLTLIDISKTRLDSARKLLGTKKNIKDTYINCPLQKIPLQSNSQDFVFSRFVFEYLKNPKTAFNELYRITKKGGKLVIGDLDNNCLSHYGLSQKLEKQLTEIAQTLHKDQLLDPWIGRKLYSFFYDRKLMNIKVHVLPHHLFYGSISDTDIQNWIAKLNQLIINQDSGKLSLSFNLKNFQKQFLSFLVSKRRFSYTPIILVEGLKK